MYHVGTIRHPVRLEDGEIEQFIFDFFRTESGRYVVAYKGEIRNSRDVLLRIESACIFGHVFGVVRCDCRFQLAQAMHAIAKEGQGMLIYGVDQDGRGLGIEGHFETYVLRQKEGLETDEVYARLNKRPDERSYADVIAILHWYGVHSVRCLTNNPRRLDWLASANIPASRVPLEVTLDEHNESCLMDEKADLGYMFTFRTHQEWLAELRKMVPDAITGSTCSARACVITKDFRTKEGEAYDISSEGGHAVATAMSRASSRSHGAVAYILGTPCPECIQAIIEGGVRKVIVQAPADQILLIHLREVGIAAEAIEG